MNHMLIVDDDNEFREMLVKTLKSQGYRAMGIAHPDKLAPTIAVHQPELILLDMMFDAETSGLDVCRRLRSWSSIPVIILSVLDDETTKVSVLDAGADDYLAKPFGINELLARVRAIQRRLEQQNTQSTPTVTLRDLVIDFDARLVRMKGEIIHLTRKEYTLLKTLTAARGWLVTYEKLAEAIWPDDVVHEKSKVRGLVMQLRNKLGEDLSNPAYILTEPGIGYRLNYQD
jgi:two-component system, OmpR family, KDP operon response regulator KdpE